MYEYDVRMRSSPEVVLDLMIIIPSPSRDVNGYQYLEQTGDSSLQF